MKHKNEGYNKTNCILSCIVALSFLLMMLISCKSVSTPQPYPTVTMPDTLLTHIRDRVITFHDTVILQVPAQTQRETVRDSSSTLETDFAVSHAALLPDGSLLHELWNKPQDYKKEVENKVVVHDTLYYRSRPTAVPVPVEIEKPLNLFQKTMIYIGIATLSVLLLYILYRLYRFFGRWF